MFDKAAMITVLIFTIVTMVIIFSVNVQLGLYVAIMYLVGMLMLFFVSRMISYKERRKRM